MSISPLSSTSPIAAPVAVPADNERTEKAPKADATEASQRGPLQDGLGTKIDVSV